MPNIRAGWGAVGGKTAPEVKKLSRCIIALNFVFLVTACWISYCHWGPRVDFAFRAWGANAALHGQWLMPEVIYNRVFIFDHGEFIDVLPALFFKLPLHQFWLIIFQVGTLSLIQVLMVAISRNLLTRHLAVDELRAERLALLANILFVLNPWVLWTVLDDVHMHTVGVVAGCLLFYRFGLEKRWLAAACGVLIAIISGDIFGPYLLMSAASLCWIHRRSMKTVAALSMAGVFFMAANLIAARLGLSAGDALGGRFGYLAPAVKEPSVGTIMTSSILHPERWLGSIWSERMTLLGYLASCGFIGLFNPVMLVGWLAMFEALLGRGTSTTGALSGSLAMTPWYVIAFVVLAPAGTVVALQSIRHRKDLISSFLTRHEKSLVLIGLANATIWFAIWVPVGFKSFLLTPGSLASQLTAVAKSIPLEDQVYTSWGTVSGFALHKYVGVFDTPVSRTELRVLTPESYFVFTPIDGLQKPAIPFASWVQSLLRLKGSKLMVAQSNLVVIRLRLAIPPTGTTITLYNDLHAVPSPFLMAQSTPGIQRKIDRNGCLHVKQNRPGYITTGYTFYRKPGTWQLQFSDQSTQSHSVEVWDVATGQLLVRRFLAAGTQDVSVDFKVTESNLNGVHEDKGWGPFTLPQQSAYPLNPLQLRLYGQESGETTVCDLSIS